MHTGRLGRWAAIALSVALSVWAIAGAVPSGAINAPGADLYQLAATPTAGRVTFAGWTDISGLVQADDGSFLVELERTDPITHTLSVAVARLLADARLDTTFGAGGTTPGIVRVDVAAYNQLLDPVGPLVPLADGRYLLGPRMYLHDGSVDATYGLQGFFAVAPNGFLGGQYVSVVRSSTNQVLAIQNNPIGLGGCSITPIKVNGFVGPLVDTSVPCENGDTVQLGDGDTLVVSWKSLGPSNFTLFFVRPDGTMDTARGQGTGVVSTQVPVSDRVRSVQLTPANQIVVGMSSILGSRVIRLNLDGTPDPTFGIQPACCLSYPGELVGLSVDDVGKILISTSGHVVPIPTQPYTLFRLRNDGFADGGFNPFGTEPAWLSATEMGITAPGIARGHQALTDGRLLVRLSAGVDASGQLFDASIVVLAPATPVRPGPTPVPTIPNVPSSGAAATQPATRLQRFAIP